MSKRVVNLIAAVGEQGQLGLNGTLPWRDPQDLKWFKQLTMGHIVVVGARTAETLPELPGRRVLIMARDMTPSGMLNILDATTHVSEELWIAGGAKTYAAWMPYITRFHIGRVDYNGAADAWFPKLPFYKDEAFYAECWRQLMALNRMHGNPVVNRTMELAVEAAHAAGD